MTSKTLQILREAVITEISKKTLGSYLEKAKVNLDITKAGKRDAVKRSGNPTGPLNKIIKARKKGIERATSRLGESVGHIEKGAFHKWLGKSEDEPITAADIAKGKAAGGHAEKMAIFAQNFGHVKEEVESLLENTLSTGTSINTHNAHKNEHVADWEGMKSHDSKGMEHHQYHRIEVKHPFDSKKNKTIILAGHSSHKAGDHIHLYDDGNGTTRFGKPRMMRVGKHPWEVAPIHGSGGTHGTVTHVAHSAHDMKSWPKGTHQLYVMK